MAIPTLTEYYIPNIELNITGTNVDAGNNDYTLRTPQCNLSRGFSIVTGTLTAMTITILTSNLDGTLKDSTADFCAGATALASDTSYQIDIEVPVKTVTIRAARSNATNAIALNIFAKR